jgi:phosphatidylinositol 4-phosphatase
LKKKFLSLWANNGDAISQQYAGTGALKADYTRTGERNLTGIMKDGMKSANRYYQRFKDNYRQIAFEVLQGVKLNEEEISNQNKSTQVKEDVNSASTSSLLSLSASEEAAQREREENIRQWVSDCRKQLIDNEDCFGCWALINYSESYDPSQIDPDVVLLFTKEAIYVAKYALFLFPL